MNTSLALMPAASRINALLISGDNLRTVTALAKIACASGLAKVSDEVQASFIILKGLELGIPPFTALDGLFVTETYNKQKERKEVTIGMTVALMLGLAQGSGQLEDIVIPDPATIKDRATVTVKRVGKTPFTFTFSMEDAQAQGLTGKFNWQRMQRVMLMNRAISGALRPVFADVLKGLYLLEEVAPDVSVDEEGAPLELPAPAAHSTTVDDLLANTPAQAPANSDKPAQPKGTTRPVANGKTALDWKEVYAECKGLFGGDQERVRKNINDLKAKGEIPEGITTEDLIALLHKKFAGNPFLKVLQNEQDAQTINADTDAAFEAAIAKDDVDLQDVPF